FQQEVGAAAQVEAEIDAALLIPARQVVEHGGRQHGGQREQHRQRREGDDSDGLPALKIEHSDLLLVLCGYFLPPNRLPSRLFRSGAAAGGGSIGFSLSSDSLARRADSPRVRMSVMVCLMMRTRTPSASSTCSSESEITLVTRPMMPPPVTTRSPRFTPASISFCCFILLCCGRIKRK